MRSIFKLSLLAASMALVAGCGDKADSKTEAKADATKAEATQVAAKAETADAGKTDAAAKTSDKFANDIERYSYGLGVSLGNYMKQNLDQNKEMDIHLKQEMILNGFKEALAGKADMTDEQAKEAMDGLNQLARTKHEANQKKLAAETQAEGDAYLASNAKKEGVKITESGLQYTVVKQGDGVKPSPSDRVKVHYTGTLIDGEKFDSSYDRNQPAVFGVNQVIKGWTEGLQLMPVGSKFTFAIPSGLAYGERGQGKIKPNSTLLFEVELLAIEAPQEGGEDAGANHSGHAH